MLAQVSTLFMLAQTQTNNNSATGQETMSLPVIAVEDIWNHLTTISWPQSMAAITIATIFLFYGWRLFRLLVTLNVVFIGVMLGRKVGVMLGSAMWGGILGCLSFGSVVYPIMKYCVSFLGGLAGAAIGAALQRGITDSSVIELAGSGAIAGLVAGAFLAFSSFKNTVMLFTSLQGAVALLAGTLSLIKNETPLAEQLKQYVFDMPMVLPAMLCAITFMGVYVQHKFLAVAGSWKMPADEGWKRN